jgi:hypothetical protein
MNTKEMESRLKALEKAVLDLQEQSRAAKKSPWSKIIGHFRDDPVYDEIVRLGREYREAQHPGSKKKKSPRQT